LRRVRLRRLRRVRLLLLRRGERLVRLRPWLRWIGLLLLRRVRLRLLGRGRLVRLRPWLRRRRIPLRLLRPRLRSETDGDDEWGESRAAKDHVHSKG